MLKEILTVILLLIYQRRKAAKVTEDFDLPMRQPVFFPLHYASWIFLISQTSSPKPARGQTNNLLEASSGSLGMKFSSTSYPKSP